MKIKGFKKVSGLRDNATWKRREFWVRNELIAWVDYSALNRSIPANMAFTLTKPQGFYQKSPLDRPDCMWCGHDHVSDKCVHYITKYPGENVSWTNS